MTLHNGQRRRQPGGSVPPPTPVDPAGAFILHDDFRLATPGPMAGRPTDGAGGHPWTDIDRSQNKGKMQIVAASTRGGVAMPVGAANTVLNRASYMAVDTHRVPSLTRVWAILDPDLTKLGPDKWGVHFWDVDVVIAGAEKVPGHFSIRNNAWEFDAGNVNPADPPPPLLTSFGADINNLGDTTGYEGEWVDHLTFGVEYCFQIDHVPGTDTLTFSLRHPTTLEVIPTVQHGTSPWSISDDRIRIVGTPAQGGLGKCMVTLEHEGDTGETKRPQFEEFYCEVAAL